LSRQDSSVAAIFGAGVQARLQLEALALVRPIGEARIWAREMAKAEAAASALREQLGIIVRAEPNPQKAVAGADVIVTTTPSAQPLIEAGWLAAGQHVTAMGSDAEHKNELAPEVIATADLYAADSLKQTRRFGELHHAIAAGLVVADLDFPELGQIVAGLRHGRSSGSELTIADLTGTGVQDTAIATLARDRARDANAGTAFET
jgi:ornithine cyclodeaminase